MTPFNPLYMPILKWRQGEYQGLMRLKGNIKDELFPLIEIPTPEWDFEEERVKKTIEEQLAKIPQRIKDKWGKRPCLIDFSLYQNDDTLDDGALPITHLFKSLEKIKTGAIPTAALNLPNNHQSAIAEIALSQKKGVGIRIKLADAANPNFTQHIDRLLNNLALSPREADLVFDLEAPNFEPLETFAKLLTSLITRIPYQNEWRTFSLCGTSFPESMGEISIPGTIIPRKEWALYLKIAKDLPSTIRKPIFGDYAIAHPTLLRMDMRLVKPSSTIRYTIDDAWKIIKGKNVRDYGLAQYYEHAKELVGSDDFMGASYSLADEHIEKCAKRTVSHGNLPTWRWIGTNHHITKVVNDLSNLSES